MGLLSTATGGNPSESDHHQDRQETHNWRTNFHAGQLPEKGPMNTRPGPLLRSSWHHTENRASAR